MYIFLVFLFRLRLLQFLYHVRVCYGIYIFCFYFVNVYYSFFVLRTSLYCLITLLALQYYVHTLQASGFMSNRGRQNVASFFTKDMNCDWRIGAEYFESVLLDYDCGSNWGNWNYVAGVGCDPREGRYFNILKQASMYDPARLHERLWLPDRPRAPVAPICGLIFSKFFPKTERSDRGAARGAVAAGGGAAAASAGGESKQDQLLRAVAATAAAARSGREVGAVGNGHFRRRK
jgi:hypothetical protein